LRTGIDLFLRRAWVSASGSESYDVETVSFDNFSPKMYTIAFVLEKEKLLKPKGFLIPVSMAKSGSVYWSAAGKE
jgi:hypothetical protein